MPVTSDPRATSLKSIRDVLRSKAAVLPGMPRLSLSLLHLPRPADGAISAQVGMFVRKNLVPSAPAGWTIEVRRDLGHLSPSFPEDDDMQNALAQFMRVAISRDMGF